MRIVRRALLWLGISCALSLSSRVSLAQQAAYAANVDAELDSATQAALTRELGRARDRGLPVEPLVAKVREGRLKRATGSRIQSAVIALASRLDSARAALGGTSTTEELIAGAEALLAGAPASSLRVLRSTTARSLASALGTLAQLVASGVAPKRATEMLVTLIRRNAGSSAVLTLGNMVESDVASGLRPDESALFRLRSIEASLGSDTVVPTASQPTPITPTTPVNTGKPVRRP